MESERARPAVLPWVATIARGQADVLVSVTDAYVSAARRLLVK